jgi:hypothetical protein
MKSPNISSGRLQKVSANWTHGVNSVRNPWALPDDQLKWAQNINIRGGIAQTRPGFSMRLSLPAGNFQGGIIFGANKQYQAARTFKNAFGAQVFQPATIWTPDGGEIQKMELSYAVFAVDGKVYYAPFPLQQPKNWSDYLLEGITLDSKVERVNFVIATQSAQTSTGGLTVTPSHRMVIVQDGISAAGYWDGSNKTGAQSSDIPLGYWMAFSGNRLWVANSNVISASDLGNPLGWQERVSGTGRGDFTVPRPVTGMVDYIGQNNDSRLFVFTDRTTHSFASGILDRAQWASTANFQNVLYPAIGCVAGKSISFQAGMMWWYSQGGLVSADVASAAYLSSQVLYKDIEMAKAKRLMSSNLTGICAVSFENYLLYSIPYLETLNSATMVLDYAAASEWNQSRSPAWAGVWTGIRPIEWSAAVIESQPRVFAFSVDYAATNDGSFNSLWEAFSDNRYDTYLSIKADGSVNSLIQRIYCQVETALMGDGMDLKQLVYGELECSQIAGTVDIRTSYRGSKGAYVDILNTRILAATEAYQYQTDQVVSEEVNKLGFLQTQHRRLTTETVTPDSTLVSCESPFAANVDKAFSFLIEWCGAMGVEAVRMFQDPYPTQSFGKVTPDEKLYCIVAEDGSTRSADLSPAPQEQNSSEITSWTSTKTRTVTIRCSPPSTGVAVSATATETVISRISQDDADTQADAAAMNAAEIAANQYRIIHPC